MLSEAWSFTLVASDHPTIPKTTRKPTPSAAPYRPKGPGGSPEPVVFNTNKEYSTSGFDTAPKTVATVPTVPAAAVSLETACTGATRVLLSVCRRPACQSDVLLRTRYQVGAFLDLVALTRQKDQEESSHSVHWVSLETAR